jgi:hypothetical protein
MSVGLTIYVTLLAALGGYIVGASIADPRFTIDGLTGLWTVWVRMFRAVTSRAR